MRDVIALRPDDWRSRLPIASGTSIGIYDVQIEASSEPSPGDIGRIEQITDILSRHLHLFAARAHIAERIRITDHRETAVSVRHELTGTTEVFRDAIGLT